MLYLVITNICTNIALLLLMALLLSRTAFFREVLLNGKDSFVEGEGAERRRDRTKDVKTQIQVGLIFSAFCILSDRIGIQVTGALPNARVIGILSAGYLGGPVSGILTAVVAAVHRYVIFPTRASTVSCVLSALVQGVFSACVGWTHRNTKEYTSVFLAASAFLAEVVHIILILVITKPFETAVEIVYTVIIPMAVMNSIGMVLFFNVFKSMYNEADLKAASMVALALRTVERCTPFLGDAVTNTDSMQKVIETILSEYHCQGAAVVKGYEFLGKSAAFRSIALNSSNYPRLLQAAKTYRTTRISRIPKPEDAFYPLYDRHVILCAPIVLDNAGEEGLALVLLLRKNAWSYQADIEFATGLAGFFATQLKIAELEQQKEALRRAEYRALQSQINPHFLFNALNTISCFCREKPEKARELLLALSSYFRNMLNDVDFMVPLERELEHVRAYVMLEEAWFEDQLKVTVNAAPEDCTCRVPSLILQPIVENAIRHGATRREHGEVTITVRREEKNTLIDVSDNGPGMDKQIIDRLYDGKPVQQNESHGIGLKNVQCRLVEIFGKDSGLQIVSGGSGTLVRMIIPNIRKEAADENRGS